MSGNFVPRPDNSVIFKSRIRVLMDDRDAQTAKNFLLVTEDLDPKSGKYLAIGKLTSTPVDIVDELVRRWNANCAPSDPNEAKP